MPQIPTARRLQLGRELRRLRERAGATRSQVAEALDCDLPKVSRIEGGKAGVSVPEVRHLLARLGVSEDETERIVEIAREAKKRSPLRVPDFVKTFVGLEAEATETRQFEVGTVPGLLQTEAYTRALTQAGDPDRDPAEVERLVTIRRERQARLTGDDNPPQLRLVMSEAVIRRMVGFGRAVMLEQLEHLLMASELPAVSVRVIPFTARPHPSMGSGFTILRLPDPDGAQVVYVEDLWTADYLDRESQVAAYVQAFDTICDVALDAQSTAEMLRKAAGEMR